MENNDITDVIEKLKSISELESNTSGQGAASIIPEEIKKWNWGAFAFNWIWGIKNKIGIIAFLPLIFMFIYPILFAYASDLILLLVNVPKGIGWSMPKSHLEETLFQTQMITHFTLIAASMIYLGLNGNILSWRKNKWLSLQEFKVSQKKWNKLAIVMTILIIIPIGILLSLTLFSTVETIS